MEENGKRKNSEREEKDPYFEKFLLDDELLKTDNGIDIFYKEYELYVQLMDKVYERGNNANAFYLSINSLFVTGIIAFLSLVANSWNTYFFILGTAFVGVLTCWSWRRTLQTSKRLIGRKYKVIHLMEMKLPAKMFDTEWEMLSQPEHKYTAFSKIELTVPTAFITVYAALGVYSILGIAGMI